MDSHQPINWQSQSSVLSLNPRLDPQEASQLKQLYEKIKLPGHVYLTSSGSTRRMNESVKLIALSYEAFLASAEAVNLHLSTSKADVWLQPLPSFHVGGLSIYARATLSGSRVFDYPIWDKSEACKNFFTTCDREKVTLTSLVPAQLYDLLNSEIECPASLRAIVIGGSALSEDLYQRAVKKKWPLLPSYGMTEVGSQIATAELGSHQSGKRDLKILSHMNLRTAEDQTLELQTPSLMSGYGQIIDGQVSWHPCKVGSWYRTADLAKVENGFLSVLGRKSQFIKVLGEGVNLDLIQAKLDSVIDHRAPELKRFYLVASQLDDRQGQIVSLKILKAIEETQNKQLKEIIDTWNKTVLPVERVQHFQYVETLPWKRSEF